MTACHRAGRESNEADANNSVLVYDGRMLIQERIQEMHDVPRYRTPQDHQGIRRTQ
jgi:hypothetical protein